MLSVVRGRTTLVAVAYERLEGRKYEWLLYTGMKESLVRKTWTSDSVANEGCLPYICESSQTLNIDVVVYTCKPYYHLMLQPCEMHHCMAHGSDSAGSCSIGQCGHVRCSTARRRTVKDRAVSEAVSVADDREGEMMSDEPKRQCVKWRLRKLAAALPTANRRSKLG